MGWTNEQQLAIDTRDRTLLVSAAAGSGKTATLTERIIQSITDEKNPADIGRMLIVTYTNAAVDELRERITKKISEKSRENPTDRNLEDQLLKIKDAKILTITSFCNGILRSAATGIGLNPSYRIAEPSEAKILSSALLESLINSAYEGELSEVCTPEEFVLLGESLANVKHKEDLADAISFVFEKLKSTEKGIDTLLPLVEEYNPSLFTSVEKTAIGGYIVSLADFALSQYLSELRKAQPLVTSSKKDQSNLRTAEADIAFAEQFLASDTYNTKRDILYAFDKGKLSHPKPEDTDCDYSVRICFLHEGLKEDVALFVKRFFSYTESEWLDLYTKLYKILTTFYKFIKRYYSDFMELKRKRGICEFSDIERYAYEALVSKDGNPTPLAKEIQGKFDYIYVDEYQDVNALQGKIFEVISNGKNRFMVGDIKQSIYGFRSARPEIFASMKNEFPALGTEGDYPAASIFMSKNFRCDEGVVDFVNEVFDRFFGLLGKNIGYTDGDRLEFAKMYKDGEVPIGHYPEIHLVEKAAAAPACNADDFVDEALKEESTAAKLQASFIADKIDELLLSGKLASGEKIQPKDIAVLFRSVESDAAVMLADELKRRKVKATVAIGGNLFLDESVLLALSMLYSIDNPRRDVYLAALMCSPLYDFSADELVIIRKSYPDEETLFAALTSYVREHPGYEKGTAFIASLLRYRKLSEGLATDALISLIYRESGLMALAGKNGGRENLILLLSYARKFEQSDFKGLYSFTSFINDVIESGTEFSSPGLGEEENSVKIMTIHKSKGLEFPVCILANASSPGRTDKEKISFSDSFGIAFKPKDDSGLALVENPADFAVRHYISRVERDEEMRVLYVALTRAREMLFVYGAAPSSDTEKYLEKIELQREIKNEYLTSKIKTLFDMVFVGGKSGRLVVHSPSESKEANSDEPSTSVTSAEPADEGLIADPDTAIGTSQEEYRERFLFKNPRLALESLPEKVSVSKLSPVVLDGSEDIEIPLSELLVLEGILQKQDEEETDSESEEKEGYLPVFMTGKQEGEAAKRGIATHAALQFASFTALKASGTKAELDRLVKEGFLSEEDRKRVREREIDAFIASPLFDEMTKAKKLHRELRFNVKLPASLFTENEEKKKAYENESVFVQGVIDCIIENEDGSLHLVDYKTDRLTRDELQNPMLADEKMRAKHEMQLYYYSLAIEKIFSRKPQKIGIYSLHCGREIPVKIKA